MPTFKIAHIREQGVDLIIVPLESVFGQKSKSDQDLAIAELQARATEAGLRGAVVAVWDSGGGRMAFIAPPKWHPFFKSIDLSFVAANINRSLSW